MIGLLKLYFGSQNSILSLYVCSAAIQDCKNKYYKIPKKLIFEKKISEKWHGLIYQNLIGKRYSKNSKIKWFKRVETIMKCSTRLIFDHLQTVNPCGLQTKK
jgi:hypothetical protein